LEHIGSFVEKILPHFSTLVERDGGINNRRF
jgi:hypothetical protein